MVSRLQCVASKVTLVPAAGMLNDTTLSPCLLTIQVGIE
jgi:hypothetical protein